MNSKFMQLKLRELLIMVMMIVMAIIEFKRMIRSALDFKLLSKSEKEHSAKF